LSALPAASDPDQHGRGDGPRPLEPVDTPLDRAERGPQPEHSLAPRKPRTLGGGVFLLVLAGTLVGVGVVAFSDWQAGLTLCGAALISGGCARLVLPGAQAGMLGVRRKLVDVSTLLLLGAALVVMARIIPPLG
jgi:hypothetical protein